MIANSLLTGRCQVEAKPKNARSLVEMRMLSGGHMLGSCGEKPQKMFQTRLENSFGGASLLPGNKPFSYRLPDAERMSSSPSCGAIKILAICNSSQRERESERERGLQIKVSKQGFSVLFHISIGGGGERNAAQA